ncbi:MAG: S-layer homology domain-containing protein [Eubacteriales bacterium]
MKCKYFKGMVASFLLFASVCTFTSEAQRVAVSATVVEDSVRQMSIMLGDAKGNMNLEKEVSRAEFATMLVAASPYKNTTTHFGYTLFPDVASSHWASGYIKVVVEQGYMLGQLDGKFSPDRQVLLEEAVTAVLCLLGYTSDSLSGTYPQAQFAKYYELDLDDYMSATTGDILTRGDCMYLFFNLMNTNDINGNPYATQLGYSVTNTGELDTMALTTANTEGPFLVGTHQLPSTIYDLETVYKNDKLATSTAFSNYDICYYNDKVNTVWIYDEKVTGRLTNIDSVYAPTTVTVAGTTYSLETTNVKYKFSVGGSYEEGDIVTLLLGQYGQVADVLDSTVTESSVVGVVIETGTTEYSDADTGNRYSRYVKLVTCDGSIVEVDTSGNIAVGKIVEVSYSGGSQSVKTLSDKELEGNVNQAGTKLGSYTFADDISILEISGEECNTIYPSRLSGAKLEEEDVRYYTTNKDGEIDRLIIEDVTGDSATFIYITSVTTIPSMSGYNSYLYNYRMGSMELSYYADRSNMKVGQGGAYMEGDPANITKLSGLEKIELSSLNALYGSDSGENYGIADNVVVYRTADKMLHLTTVEEVSNPEKYELVAYYDDGLFSAGGKIRIIVATPITD